MKSLKTSISLLHRYRLEFDDSDREHLWKTRMGIGVTAYTYEDGLNILREKVFEGGDVPPVRTVIEDIDIRTLDPGHILPNMASCIWRGVWFPLGLDSFR